VKHITVEGLDRIEDLLTSIRASIRKIGTSGLKEKKRGIWYRKSNAFLHFHEDPAGIFADLKHDDGTFHRFAVNTAQERASFLAKLRDLAASQSI
jgi:hypothetical protein